MQHSEPKKHLTIQSELINSCIDGDRRAQRKLFDAMSPKMFSLCVRYMGNRELAEDVLQDGFVTLFTKLSDYGGTGSFEGWARRIFITTALMALRKNDVLKISDDIDTAWEVSSQEAGPVRQIGYKELLLLIAELPPGYRIVFNMFAVEGYTHKEIAQILGVTEATSRSQFHRARKMLQDKIKELDDAG